MKPSEIRTELIAQHEAVRSMARRTGELVARMKSGEAVRVGLGKALGELADAMRAHNEREEALLREIIPTVDAWGPARAAVMLEQHRLEHHELHAAVLGARDESSDAITADSVEALLASIVKHMEREEEAFLSEEVLRDDNVSIYSFGG